MAERASMPLFVPRTVAAFERSANVLARRMTAPARTLAGRALAFADRVLGSWAATGGEGERPAMRASERGGAMVVPRPWYEQPAAAGADPDATGWSAPASQPAATTAGSARRGAAIAQTNVTLPPTVVDDARVQARAAEMRAATAQAAADVRAIVESRGAERVTAERATAERATAERAAEAQAQQRAIADREVQSAQRTTADATAQAARQIAAAEARAAQQATADSTQRAASDRKTADTQQTVETRAAQDQAAPRALAGGGQSDEASAATAASGQLPARTGGASQTAEAARVGRGDVRAAEALALHVTRPQPVVAAQPRTPLARALSHQTWVDAQLHTAPLFVPSDLGGRATGYVFIAPADIAANADRADAGATSTSAAGVVRMQSPPTPGVQAGRAPPTTAAGATSPPISASAASRTPVAEWNPAALSALPDVRLAPATVAQHVFDFVARLVGVQAARDVAAPFVADATTAASVRAPATPLVTPAAELVREGGLLSGALPKSTAEAATRSPVATSAPSLAATIPARATIDSAVSWRPGAAGARSEQLGIDVDARIGAAWGEPSARPSDAAATSYSASYVIVGPDATRAVDAATGPARLARFMDTLVGVQAARATAQLSVAPTVQPASPATSQPVVVVPMYSDAAASTTAATQRSAGGTSSRAQAAGGARVAGRDRDFVAAMARPDAARAARPRSDAPGDDLAPTGLSARAPARVNLASLVPASAAAAMAPGGLGVRAEQLGGAVGVRAASLSIDFVDPARLAALRGGEIATPRTTSGHPAASGSSTTAPAMDTIMPPPRPLLAMRPLAEMPALTAEEWSLVATFPSASTAVQLVAARQAAHWPTAAERGQALPQTWLAGSDATAAGGADRQSAMIATAVAADRAARAFATSEAVAPRSSMATPALTASAMAVDRRAAAVEPRVSAAALRGGAPSDLVAPAAMRSVTSLDAARLPGGRAPRGGFLWPRLGDFATTSPEFTASPAMAIAESAKDVAPGAPLWGGLRSLVSVAPGMAADFDGASGLTPTRTAGASAAAAVGGRPREGGAPALAMLTTSGVAGGRAPSRGGAVADSDGAKATAAGSPGSAASSRALASSSSGATSGAARPSLTLANVGGLAAATSLQGTSAAGRAPSTPALVGPAARALELARPFLKLAEGSATSDETRNPARAPRFYEQAQPLVSAQSADPAATSIVAAMRSLPTATSSGDDRVTLADLTLISMASATQQVAASPAGSGPSSASSSSSASPGDGGHAGAGAAAGGGGNPVQEIEELARAAFQELQRLITLERERGGDPWES